MTRVLVTGSRGQVGAALVAELQGRAEVVAHDRASMDLMDAAAIRQRVIEARPDVVVNAAAYTAVDRAETEQDAAHAVNGVAPGVMAQACREVGALLVHYSTDYVFDGARAAPWVEDDPVAPLNTYGRTKLEGERAIAAAGCPHLILRTSWVYGPHGGNFMLTMLRAGEARDELRVVADQRGAPTSSLQLARLTRELIELGRDRLAASSGIYHATAAGVTTWFGFAQAIFANEVLMAGRAKRPRLVPITTAQWPTPARRPANSVLSTQKLRATFGLAIAPWSEGLDEVAAALRRA